MDLSTTYMHDAAAHANRLVMLILNRRSGVFGLAIVAAQCAMREDLAGTRSTLLQISDALGTWTPGCDILAGDRAIGWTDQLKATITGHSVQDCLVRECLHLATRSTLATDALTLGSSVGSLLVWTGRLAAAAQVRTRLAA